MYRIYQIVDERSLDDIANKFDTNVDTLKQINGIDDTYIVSRGNYLIVPTSNGESTNSNFITYIVKPGDSIYAIAEKYNVNYRDLLDLNGLSKDQYIYPNQQILVPREGVLFKVTIDGDTITSVSEDMNVNGLDLINQNKSLYLIPDQLIVYKK